MWLEFGVAVAVAQATAVAPIQLVAQEPPYAMGAAQEIATTKDKKKKKERERQKTKKKVYNLSYSIQGIFVIAAQTD